MRVLRWAFPSFLAAREWLDLRLTSNGKICVAVLAICLVLVLQATAQVTGLFAMFSALVVISAAVNFLYWPRLRARPSGRLAVHCGQDTAVTLRLANVSWMSAYDLELKLAADPRLWQPVSNNHRAAAIQGGGELSWHARLRPRRRGVFAW